MTMPEHLNEMSARALSVIARINENRVVERPLYTDAERLLNYWNGYRAAIDEIERFIAENG